MYDPVALAIETERRVSQGDRRRYYRFRGARFYGGIATADCVGCCLRCVFCWGWNRVVNPGGAGKLYSPGRVANRITDIAVRREFHQARLSGAEPTLARAHLLPVLERLPADMTFILETNGIPLGQDRGYAMELAAFPNLHVRVSLKGCTPDEFSRLTGAEEEAYDLPLKALHNLMDAGVDCHPAVVTSFSASRSLDLMTSRLHEIHPQLADFEPEEIFLNPSIAKRLEQHGLTVDRSR